ncbi:MAG TPA: TIM barrel protein [Pirellulaceae bacterium]|nr:TIM barrel protein [Pirellulaceae bacterium]
MTTHSSATSSAGSEYKPKGRVNHSIVHWCYGKSWNVEETCRIAVQLGCKSIEVVGPEHWPTLKKYGLVCALAPSHLFTQGMNNPKYHPMCIELMRKAIDDCADAGFPAVITFTGFAEETGEPAGGKNPDMSRLPPNRPVISPDDGIKNCVAGFKQIVGYAEKKGINLSLEMLNSRVDVEMKGHPGYQGDHIDYCLEILRQVGSPRLGLLFDIYHVQIMDGDLITRVKQCREYINHVHTAGVPGRCELDENQEINYPPVVRAIVEQGFSGYVGHEFIPTRDPLDGLREAVRVCDV